MPFVDRILEYGSVAFVGMDKNCGKTEAMNYFLQRANLLSKKKLAVTSIGIDGEQTDQVTRTPKPEITLCRGNLFVTCEAFYPTRAIGSEIIDTSHNTTALGRLIRARVVDDGKVILSGPSDTLWLRREISKLHRLGAELVVVDGALSRKSIASPTVTDSLVLCTGAALSHNISDIVSKTAYQIELIELPSCSPEIGSKVVGTGIFSIVGDELVDSGLSSIFLAKNSIDSLLERSNQLLFTGVINDSLFEKLLAQRAVRNIEVVAMDFTKIFVSNQIFERFKSRGGSLTVVNRSQLEAVCANPLSPRGFMLNSHELCSRLSDEICREVYDVKKL